MDQFDLVEITHFINPYLFWINRLNEFDNEYEIFYKKVNEYAQNAETCTVKIGKIYAVKDSVKGIWVRGEIEREEDARIANSMHDISNPSLSYKVWLIDEGRPALIVTPAKKLSSDLRNKEAKCERAILFGVSPATCEINQEKGVFEKRRISSWQANATSVIKNLLSKKNVQVYFRTQKSLESAVVGDLLIASKSMKINVAEYLVEKRIAFFDEEYFFKYQRNYLYQSVCRVDTPNESVSLSTVQGSQNKNNLVDLLDEFDSDPLIENNKNTSERLLHRQKPIPIINKSELNNPLEEIDDMLDSSTSFRVSKMITSSPGFGRGEILKAYQQEKSENESFEHVPCNRTIGRGVRKPHTKNNTSGLDLSSASDSDLDRKNDNVHHKDENEIKNKFSSHAHVQFIDCELDDPKSLRSSTGEPMSPERSARKKLFDIPTSTSHRKTSKKLFTEIKSINVIENQLTNKDDFYDSVSDETDKNDVTIDENVKKGKKYLCHKRRTQESANCIAVIKNIEETENSDRGKIIEEIIVNPHLEDDRVFLERMKIKEEMRQAKMNELLQLNKQNVICSKDAEKGGSQIEVQTVPDSSNVAKTRVSPSSSMSTNHTMKSSARLLLKKIKIKSPDSSDKVTTKISDIHNMSSSSSTGGDISVHSLTPASSDETTDMDCSGSSSATENKESNNIQWPKIKVPTKKQLPVKLIPAGQTIPQPKAMSKSEKNNQNQIKSNDNAIDTIETFLDKKIKALHEGRNVKSGDTTSMIKITAGDKYAPYLLIHSMKKITPVQNVAQAYLHQDIQDVLQYMKITELNGLQSYVWSAVNRGENVVAIWSRSTSNQYNYDESSCLMYIPVLCNTVIQNNYDDLGNSNGPIALILCAHKTAAHFIHKIITELLRTLSLRETMEINKCRYNKEKLRELKPSKSRTYLLLDNTEICRGCDIVITTPKCFLRRINGMGGHCTDLRRLCHLVLDDGDIITERNSKELNDILLLCRKMLDRRRNATRNIQLIVTGEKWNSGIEELCKETPVKPAICISSHIEAAIYAKVNINLQFIKSEAKIEVLFDLIHNKVSNYKTILMCNKYDEISEIETILQAKGINVVTLAKKMSATQVKHTFDLWNSAVPGAYQLLILSDDILADVQITSAMWLIHYSLPRTWTHFSNRFYTLTNNYQPLFAPDKKNTSKVHIFIDETHQDVIPRMVHFLQRMKKFNNSEIYKNLLEMKEKVLVVKEEKKLRNNKNIPFCYSLLSCGQCPIYLSCKKRHMFFKQYDQPQFNIEIGSEIKIRILEIYDSIHYSIRLMDVNNSNYKILAMELVEYYRDHSDVVEFIEIGKLYSYRKSNNLYERCKVVEKKVDMLNEYYKILLIDTGEKKVVKSSSLRYLPEQFQRQLPYALEMFVADVKPYDDEIVWNIEGKTKIKELLTSVEINKPNVHVMGTVRLIVDKILWLENVRVFEYFDNTRTTVEKLNLSSELLREQIATRNPDHINSLLQLTEKAGIQYKFNKKATEKRKRIQTNKPLAVQYAYLPVGTDFEKVFFLSTSKGHRFYVGRCEFNKQYFNLMDDIKATVTESLYPTKVEIQEEAFYLAFKNNEYFRVQIVERLSSGEVVCFLIDEGYEEVFQKEDLKPIFQWMLSRLPAQAILCRLYGVNYDAEGLEKYEDSNFPLWAKCIKRDPDGTYAILLMKENKNRNILINSVILQEMNSSPVPDETFNADDFYLKSDISSDSDDDLNSCEIESSKVDIQSDQPTDLNSDMAGSDDSDRFSVEIDDVNEFFDKLVTFRETKPKIEYSTNDSAISPNNTTNRTVQKSIEGTGAMMGSMNSNLMERIPKYNKYTPTVLWYQKCDSLILKIQLAQIKKYELNITEESLYFKTDYDDREYELDLTFYDKVDSRNFEDQAKAFEVIIKLTKLKKGKNWPRLLRSTQRFRNIKVDLNHELSDDETKPKVQPYLSQISNIPCEESSDLDVDFGSDLDNDSSDIESDSSTEAVKQYGLRYAFGK